MADFQHYAPTTCAHPCRTHPLCICTSIQRFERLEAAVRELQQEMGLRRADEPATERDEPADGEVAL